MQLSSELKYLGITLDKGLAWKKQLDKIINMAYKAFWTCRGTFGKTWGLKPKVVYWIYTAVLRPIVTYASTVCWPRVKFKQVWQNSASCRGCLSLNYRSNLNNSDGCNGGPTWTPPTALQVEEEAMLGSYRLRYNEQWKPNSVWFGHAYMARDMEKVPILQMESDKIIPVHVYENPFTIILTEVNGKSDFNPIETGA
jgi:hypothetical protein